MKVTLLQNEVSGDDRMVRILAKSKSGNEDVIWTRLPAAAAGSYGNHLLASTLLPAMALGESLELPLPVDSQLLGELDRLQAIFSTWEPRLRVVPVEAEAALQVETSDITGAFFTGGADSLYTVLANRDSISALMYVHGFDVPLDDEPLWQATRRNVASAAHELGKPLWFIETNLREVFDQYLGWRMTHGFALAAIAHAVGARKVYISASHTYRQLIPCGSHPLTDPLWSTSGTRIVHDGAERTRIEKIREVAKQPALAQFLCVCWRSRGVPLNCGRCEKCLRTMISMAIVTGSRQWPAFPVPLNLEQVKSIEAFTEPAQMFIEENLSAAEAAERPDEELIAALREARHRSQRTWSAGKLWASGRRRVSMKMDKLIGKNRGRAIRGLLRKILFKNGIDCAAGEPQGKAVDNHQTEQADAAK